ncbi:DUF1961 family protein [Endozoicomonas elysicola]|uniref:3-keto-disaccharide hydrolase domain-containing protein n=1 Tax=Endozoicomonas elysicola TaxID=305900 RepID=A0A081K593_9GAMM|nr:DUF1961 family protein [Endozoicomonas elysicola]KEI69319.1 hypothetical protein GV64_24540 [Endozoicomonas elysicola]
MKHILLTLLSTTLIYSSTGYGKLTNDPNKKLSDSYLNHPIYGYDFKSNEQLSDWTIEGFGQASIEHGKLILEPEFHQPLLTLQSTGKYSDANEASEYGDDLAAMVKEKYPLAVDKMYVDGVFRGGHFNIWNKNTTPENYSISFDFQSLSPQSLHMIMFSAQGLNGQDVLHGDVAPRTGLASEIMRGDVTMYRISYFFPFRKSANMRKSPGRHMTASGRDIASENPEGLHKMVVTKWNGEVNYFVNGEHALSYTDKKPLSGGNWGFRLMVLAKGAYSNINVYQLDSNPVMTGAK